MHRKQFEELALEHLDAVYRMALQLSRHPEDASDLAQETYLKALRAADRYEEQGGGIRPWLFKILHNIFYTQMSRAQRQKNSSEQLPDAVSNQPAPDGPALAWDMESLDWEAVDERLKSAIDRLKPEYRSVLLMWGVEGMRYREIAEVQEVPIGTIMSRLHRARQILALQLAELAEEKRIIRG